MKAICAGALLLGFVVFPVHQVAFAEDQAATPVEAEKATVDSGNLKVGNLPCNKVLILGNSITIHGSAPQIGWTGKWGMAASAEEKDFVHVLTTYIAKAAGSKPQVMTKNIADFERQLTEYDLKEHLKAELAFQADIIVIALGENATALKTEENKAKFRTAFTSLLAEARKSGHPAIFVRGQFWPDAAKDQLMQEICETAGGCYVNISQLGADEKNYARAERSIEHAGVAAHPGDKGMNEIATAIWAAIQKQASAK